MSDKANDTPFEVTPTFRSVAVGTEVSLDPSDQRLRFEDSVGAYYPNPDGEFFFVTLTDVDRDGMYEADGSPVAQPGWLLRVTANDGSVISADLLPLGALSPISAVSPRPSAVAATIASYQTQLGVTQSRLAYGVMGRVDGGTFTPIRIGTADPEPDEPVDEPVEPDEPVDPPVDPPVVLTPPSSTTPTTHLRHSSRHVLATVLNIVRDQLDALGWMDDTALPFGPKYSTKVRFIDAPAFNGESLDAGIEPGVIAVTLGTEFNPDEQEIGGPLTRQDYPIFFDVFQGSHPATTACANDIRDILLGRFEGTRRHVPIIDQSTSTRVHGWTAELVDVEITRPEIRLPLHWQVVKVTAECYFNEVDVVGGEPADGGTGGDQTLTGQGPPSDDLDWAVGDQYIDELTGDLWENS